MTRYYALKSCNRAWNETQWYVIRSSYTHCNLLHIPATMFGNAYIFHGYFHSLIHNKLESPFPSMYNMMTCMFTLLHMASLVNVLKNQVDATFECPVIRFFHDKMLQVH